MKVAHVLSSLNPGGAEVLTLDYLRRARWGGENFLLYRQEGALLDLFKRTDCQMIQIPEYAGPLRRTWWVRRFLSRYQIDILHIHSVTNPVPFVTAALGCRTKVVLTVHGYSIARNKTLDVLAGGVDKYLYVSKTLKDTLSKALLITQPDKHVVLYNGVDPGKFAVRRPARSEEKDDNRTFRLGMIGNFNSVRDHLTVCKALRKVTTRRKDIRFQFVGAAQSPAHYQRCYDFCERNGLLDYVTFTGPRTDVPEILSTLDVFVYASNHDTFGIAVVEAMMSGTPVIVNDLDVFQEITDDGYYACLYRTGESRDLAKRICWLLDNDAERRSLSGRCRAWAEDRFSIAGYVAALEGCYRRVHVGCTS